MKMRRYLEPNAHENIIYQNVWAVSTTVLSGNFTALYIYTKKEETGWKLVGHAVNARC